MNYIENGEWVGFDTEFAILVGEKLGLEVEFQLINWDRKYAELNSRTITAIWNGFTATASEKGMKRTSLCDMSYSYMLNTQCVVVKTERLQEFSAEKDMTGTSLSAETGSSGEEYATKLVSENGKIIRVSAKSDALSEVMSGTADGAVVDLAFAKLLGTDDNYPGLSIAFELYPEVYAIGFRKGDSLRDKVNKAIKELYNDGSLYELAKKYGIENNLALDTAFGQEDCDC
jgi:polar amino acid transport system substrate-binding protein